MQPHKLIAAIVGVLALAGGLGYRAGALGSEAPPQPPAPASLKPAPRNLVGGDLTESVFVPISPCRIVDTRQASAGRLAVGPSRAFDIKGTGAAFATQGGTAGGCAVPESAQAIEATVTAVDAGSGFLRAWPGNQPAPNATFMNYTSAFNVSNTGTVAIDGCTATCPSGTDLRLRAFGSATDVVVDVNGYYISQMTAEVGGTGILLSGSRVTSVTKLTGGQYEVIFDRDLVGCSFQATPSSATVSAQADLRAFNHNGAFVSISNASGNYVDNGFHLLVVC